MPIRKVALFALGFALSNSSFPYELATHAKITNAAFVQSVLGSDIGLQRALGIEGWTLPTKTRDRQDAKSYSDRDIYLKKQDPKNPNWHFSDGEEICTEARTREAAAAGVQFLKLDLAERTKYGSRDQGMPALERMIQRYSDPPLDTTTNK